MDKQRIEAAQQGLALRQIYPGTPRRARARGIPTMAGLGMPSPLPAEKAADLSGPFLSSGSLTLAERLRLRKEMLAPGQK